MGEGGGEDDARSRVNEDINGKWKKVQDEGLAAGRGSSLCTAAKPKQNEGGRVG